MTADELLATHRRALPWIIANEIMAGALGFIFGGVFGLVAAAFAVFVANAGVVRGPRRRRLRRLD